MFTRIHSVEFPFFIPGHFNVPGSWYRADGVLNRCQEVTNGTVGVKFMLPLTVVDQPIGEPVRHRRRQFSDRRIHVRAEEVRSSRNRGYLKICRPWDAEKSGRFY